MAKKAMRISRPEFEEDITSARPRPIDEQLPANDRGEAGLTLDADSLGERFLLEATEQRNMESSALDDLDERSITEGAPSDDALSDASFDPTRDIWENTVALAAERDRHDGAVMLTSSLNGDDDEAELSRPSRAARRDRAPAVVLTESVVREASLFDQIDSEHDREDDTYEPRIETDDVGHHASRH